MFSSSYYGGSHTLNCVDKLVVMSYGEEQECAATYKNAAVQRIAWSCEWLHFELEVHSTTWGRSMALVACHCYIRRYSSQRTIRFLCFFFFSRHSQQRFRNRLSLVEPATASSHRTCQHFRLYGCQVQGGFDRTIDAALETKKLNRWYFWSIWSKATVVAVAVCLPDEFLLQQTNCKMDSDK